MKLIFLGNKEECAGFSLAGAESIIATDNENFGVLMEKLLKDSEGGVVVASDRFASYFEKHISPQIKKRAIPTVVFVPSIEGRHMKKDIKGYISSVLGIRL